MSFHLWQALLTGLAALFVIYPFLRRGPVRSVDNNSENVAIYRRNLLELDGLLEKGDLDLDEYRARKDEMGALLVSDYRPQLVEVQGREWGPAAGVVLLVLTVAASLLLYNYHGQWRAVELQRQFRQLSATSQPEPSAVAELLAEITAYARTRDDAGGWWYLAAGGFAARGDYAAAAEGYRKALAEWPEDPTMWAELGQALYLAGDRQLSAETTAALNRAVQLDPHQVTAQGVLGISAYERGDYGAAISAWEQALRVLPPMSSQAATLKTGIAQARAALAASGGQAEAAAPQAVAGDASIAVAVSLGEGVELQQSDVVFVFARALQGPPMPLAVKRVPASQLPARFVLSEADAMQAGMGIAEFDQVRVAARLSRSGNPIAQPGDWESEGTVVNTRGSTDEISLVINKLVQ